VNASCVEAANVLLELLVLLLKHSYCFKSTCAAAKALAVLLKDPSSFHALLPVQYELSQHLGILQRRVHRGVKDLYTICNSLLALGVSEQQVKM
jgi:hypothetical protein